MNDTQRTVIGFDLGHGESALASLWTHSDDSPKTLVIPGSDSQRVITAVGVKGDGTVEIGERAIRNPHSPSFLAFKSADIDEPGTRYAITLFVEEVIRRIAEEGQSSENTTWIFGTPSGWTSHQLDGYSALLAELCPGEVQVIPESRAALLQARDSGELKRGEQRLADQDINQGVLIVDVGSSTTDYTWVVGRDARPVDNGHVRLGTALIDQEIMRRVSGAHGDQTLLAAALDEQANRVKLELACRRAKERFFSGGSPDDDEHEQRLLYSEELRTADGERITVHIRLSAKEMWEILDTPQLGLDNRSWREAFQVDVAAAVQVAAGNGPAPRLILLTGGGSRMWFVKDVCRELVGRVIVGQEPELTIAKGLALFGRTAHRADRFRTEVKEFIESGAVQKVVAEHFPELARNLGTAFADGKMEKYVVPAFVRWRDGGIRTLNGVTTEVAAAVERELADDKVAGWLTPVVVKWQNEVATLLAARTRPICTRSRIPEETLTLPPVKVNDTQVVPVVKVGMALEVVSRIGNVLAAVVTGVVAATAAAISATLAIGGPVSLSIVAIGGLIVAFTGKEAAMKKLQTVDLYSWVRKTSSEKALKARLLAQSVVFEQELAAAFTKEFSSSAETRLADSVSRAVEEQLKMLADQAEILISMPAPPSA